MAACVGEMTNTVAKSEGTLDAAQSSGDLPLVSGFLVGVVSSNKELLRLVGYQETLKSFSFLRGAKCCNCICKSKIFFFFLNCHCHSKTTFHLSGT